MDIHFFLANLSCHAAGGGRLRARSATSASCGPRPMPRPGGQPSTSGCQLETGNSAAARSSSLSPRCLLLRLGAPLISHLVRRPRAPLSPPKKLSLMVKRWRRRQRRRRASAACDAAARRPLAAAVGRGGGRKPSALPRQPSAAPPRGAPQRDADPADTAGKVSAEQLAGFVTRSDSE